MDVYSLRTITIMGKYWWKNFWKIMNTYDHNQDPLTEMHIDAKWVERSHAYSRKMSKRVNMHLASHMYKIITLKANAKKIVTVKGIWHHVCKKTLLWRQMLRNRYFKMCLTPNMYKIVTLKANAKEIVTWTCIWHHICTKSLLWKQMLRKSSL